MSDLHCPARIFVARHGEVEYESEPPSDAGGSLSQKGRAQSRQLGLRLRGERVARIYASTMTPAVQTAEIAAAILGADVVIERLPAEFEMVADQHRGESVLVVVQSGAIRNAVPALEGRLLPHGGVVELEADGDGWRALSWCGGPPA